MQRSEPLRGPRCLDYEPPLNHAGHERSRYLLGEVEFLGQLFEGKDPSIRSLR